MWCKGWMDGYKIDSLPHTLTLNSSLTIIASSTSEAGSVVTDSVPGSLIPSVDAFFNISKS